MGLWDRITVNGGRLRKNLLVGARHIVPVRGKSCVHREEF
jgi:hypothetical protein